MFPPKLVSYLCILVAAAGLAVPGRALVFEARASEVPKVTGLPAPENVDVDAQAQLKARMGRHGNTMTNLVRAVVLLDRPVVRALAQRIAEEEIVARTDATKGKKRLAMPPEFYQEQDALRLSAQQLAAAALTPDDDKELADRFAALARTCVMCHSVYLHGRFGILPSAPRP